MNIAWILLLLTQIGFSYSYPLSKQIVQILDPIVWSTLRVLFAASFLIIFSKFSNNSKFTKTIPHLELFILGLCGVSLNQYFFIEGLKTSSPTDAAIMATSIPVWVFVGSLLKKIEKFSLRKSLGILSGIAGIIVLFGRPSSHVSHYLILNSAIYSIYVVYGYKYMKSENPIYLLSHLFFYGAVGLVLITSFQVFIGKAHIPSAETLFHWQLFSPMLQVVAFGTILPYLFNIYSTKHLSPIVVSMGITLQPPITAFLDFIIRGTHLSPGWVISGSLVALGVFLTSGKKTLPSTLTEN